MSAAPLRFRPKEAYALILTMLMDEVGLRTDAAAKAVVAGTFLVLKQNGEPIAEWKKLRKLVHIPACRKVLAGTGDADQAEWPAKALELLNAETEDVSSDTLRAIRIFKRDLTEEKYAEAMKTVKTKLEDWPAPRNR